MPIGFDTTLSELTEEMTESLPPSEKENKEKREHIKAYFRATLYSKRQPVPPSTALLIFNTRLRNLYLVTSKGTIKSAGVHHSL